MKKRILSILLAVLMLLSVLPVTALAVDGPTTDVEAGTQHPTSVSANKDAIHVNKSVVTDTETGKTSLELEAFATNTVSTETTYEPLDIVLVLDVSGSMGTNNIKSYKYTETAKKEWSCNDIYNSSVYYYYKDSEGDYHRVSWDDEGGGWFSGPYRCWITAGGTRIGEKVSNWNYVSYRGKLYTRTNEGNVTRMQALKTAVNKFIDNVAAQKDSEGNAIKNHISIVKFAGKMQAPDQYKVGNDMYESGTYNYSQIVKDMTDVSTGSAALKAAVTRLNAGGATSADYGMQLASHVLSQHKDDPVRKSVVIMFTDGEPNHTSGFDGEVAKDAIAAAKGLKEKNTVVFTIGIFDGAKPSASVTSNSTSNTNKYMHAVSSNYPTARCYWNKGHLGDGHIGGYWDWDFGDRAKDSNYYLAASNAADLEDIFVEISKEVNSLTAKIDTTSVLSDTLSGAFTFDAPQNAEYSGITVAKYPVTGMENGVYTWGAAQELTIGEGKDVQVKVTDKKLEVTGFDYGTNAVTTTEGSTELKGYKLVVTIPIKPDTSYSDWKQDEHYYDTNANAGLSYGENGSQKLELTDSPEAPVTAYTVTYTDGVDNETVFEDQASTVLPGTATPAFNGGTPTRENYEFNGWSPAVAETVTDNATYTATWTEKQVQKYKVTYQYPDTKPENATPPTDDTDYTVGQEYTLQTVTAPTGWTFDGWYKSYDNSTNTFSDEVTSSTENKMVEGGVTLYGKWTAPAEKFTVSYKFVSADGTTLPSAVTTKTPDSKQVAKDTTETPATFADVSVTGGTWKFNGWTPTSHTITSDFEFIGTWKFTSSELPPETTYDVSLTISKTVDNVHGTAPAEDYKFVVYYIGDNDQKVYLTTNPLTISLAAGEDSKEKDFTIKMTQTQLNNWPETLVTEGIYEGKVRFVYVEEIDGGTDHMTYAKAPVRGQFVGIAISSMRSVTKYFLYSEKNWQGIFEFTNVYDKRSETTDRDVTPAKVSPQLNRDDHVAYIMGYPDGTVQPEGEITRAEACTIFFRLLTEESRDYYFSRTNDYTDVSRTDWFNNAISTLSNAGIVTGYADGTFRPDQPITRGEMAKIIANFARLGGATKSFTDLSGHWAKSYVELAAGNGWIAGYPDGTFRPDQKITRAETVTMINRVLERVPAKESRLLSRSVMLTFPDNKPGEWYYIAVQEASNSHTYQRSAYETAGDEMWLRLIENVDWTKLEK